ncbi:hypothetical protein STENM327S_06941 [Streptomyces tendae]
MELPSDLKLTFEGAETGDPVKDAVLADNAERMRAVDAAIAGTDPEGKALGFYNTGKALEAAVSWVGQFEKANATVTGQVRYFDRKVELRDKTSAVLTLCAERARASARTRRPARSRRHRSRRTVTSSTTPGSTECRRRLADVADTFHEGGGPVPAVVRGSVCAVVLAGITVLASSPTAWADIVPGGAGTGSETQVDGGKGDQSVSATAGAVVFDRSKNGSGASVGRVAAATNWTPPACYYAPKYTPEQLKKAKEPVWEAESTGYQWDAEQRDKYVNGKPYKDFNKEKAGEGYWWDSYVTPGREGDPGALDCNKDTFWVDTGDDPPADIPQAITPEVLAQLAYAEIRVPTTEVELRPAGETKVNLPTWAWLDATDFKPVSVTASVPLLGVKATTTAEPVSVKIDPGTADAQTYPASGVCEAVNGSIGEPYAKGKADETPPCGVKYLRSSGNGSYQLKATVTWKIHWTGTGVTGEQPLPDGDFGGEQNVVVQEIQAVNR